MFPNTNCFYVESLAEFFENILPSQTPKNCKFFDDLNYDDKEKEPLWFRGQSSSEWNLIPALYRKISDQLTPVTPDAKNIFWKKIQDAEKDTIEEFQVRNYHLISNQIPTNDYLWLSLMQHYNLSTRLLDWSEDVITALFFSLSLYFKSTMDKKVNNAPCVWILRPYRLKQLLVKQYNDIVNKEEKVEENPLLISSLLSIPNDKNRLSMYNSVPLPVLCPYNSDRIHAQSGVFTIFPIDHLLTTNLRIEPWKFCLEGLEFSDEFLIKIVIISPKKMSDDLKKLGFKLSMFFPEIPNISSEIETKYLRDIH